MSRVPALPVKPEKFLRALKYSSGYSEPWGSAEGISSMSISAVFIAFLSFSSIYLSLLSLF